MKNEIRSLKPEESHSANQVVVESGSSNDTRKLRTVDPRGYIARSVAIMGLAGVALIPVLDSGSKYHESPYIFWMYVALMVGSLLLASTVLHMESQLGWAAVGSLAGLTATGYVLSRTTGLPGSTRVFVPN